MNGRQALRVDREVLLRGAADLAGQLDNLRQGESDAMSYVLQRLGQTLGSFVNGVQINRVIVDAVCAVAMRTTLRTPEQVTTVLAAMNVLQLLAMQEERAAVSP